MKLKFVKSSIVLSAVVLAFGSQSASAAPVVYNFDALSDGTALTNQIVGLTFSHATVLAAGQSLNELEFPPRSGSNVVTDDGGAVSILFASPVFSVGGFFTYISKLQFAAYDVNDVLLGIGSSVFASNMALSGDTGSSTNERMSFEDASGRIARFEITGDPSGGSFTMDDLTVDARSTVPEPETLVLVMSILAAGCIPGGWLRRRRD